MCVVNGKRERKLGKLGQTYIYTKFVRLYIIVFASNSRAINKFRSNIYWQSW